MLNSTATEECLDVYIENDILVEGTEIITLSLDLREADSALGIRDITPNTTDIIVEDDDSELYVHTYIHTCIHTYTYELRCMSCMGKRTPIKVM